MGKNIKQDINFLNEPLWFQNVRAEERSFVWQDRERYVYRSSYTPPDKVDMLILLYFIKESQQAGYEPDITTSRYEVLKECGFSISRFYYKRLHESLKRWNSVSIYFRGTFYDGKKYHAIGFHIVDDYKIAKDTKLITLSFNKNWMLKVKHSKYFKYINFELYKALKRPVSRRLHEVLCTKFLGRDKWPISLTRLGEVLTLSGRKVGDKEVIYASDVLVAVKPAINEINRLSLDPGVIRKTGISPRDLFTITYEIKGEKQDRVIIFQCHPARPGRNRSLEIENLLELANKRSDKLEKLISEYCQKHNGDYVKWNILYANKNAKKNYTKYLEKSLAGNWAQEWQEDEQARIQAEQESKDRRGKELEEKNKIEELQKRVESQRPLFKQAVDNLSDEDRESLWQKAEMMVDDDAIRREFVVKIHYIEFLLEYFNENGKDFLKEVVSDLGFIAEL